MTNRRLTRQEPFERTIDSDGATVQAVERAFDVLEQLAEAAGRAGLADLAHATDLPYGTIHRLLRTLAARGYVRQEDDTRKYVLGLRLIGLGDAAGRVMATVSRPHLEALVQSSGESANLAVMDGDRAVYVDQVPSPHRLRIFAEVGRHVLPHCTAVGKVLLAWRSEAEAVSILRRTGMPARTSNTITSLPSLLDAFRQIREGGYALDRGEEEAGVDCIAVPVWGEKTVVAAISLSGPADRIALLDFEAVVREMQDAALALAEAYRST